jgi:hypothetical protein
MNHNANFAFLYVSSLAKLEIRAFNLTWDINIRVFAALYMVVAVSKNLLTGSGKI